jgi:hypothetical protein
VPEDLRLRVTSEVMQSGVSLESDWLRDIEDWSELEKSDARWPALSALSAGWWSDSSKPCELCPRSLTSITEFPGMTEFGPLCVIFSADKSPAVPVG